MKFKILAVLALPLIISCTGHPAAGQWRLSDPGDYQYTRLVVNFDGKAELYKANVKNAWLHCFWTARADDIIGLKCGSADENAANELFDFKVSAKNSGQLMIANRIVAHFDNEESIND